MKVVIELRDNEDKIINPCTVSPDMYPKAVKFAKEILGDVKEFNISDEKLPEWAVQCATVDVLALAIAGHMIRTGKNRWETDPI